MGACLTFASLAHSRLFTFHVPPTNDLVSSFTFHKILHSSIFPSSPIMQISHILYCKLWRFSFAILHIFESREGAQFTSPLAHIEANVRARDKTEPRTTPTINTTQTPSEGLYFPVWVYLTPTLKLHTCHLDAL